MSKNTKWKLDKNKVKVVFRLQFHATHIPLTGWDKLFISFIPADSGKTTAKTTKANVRNGTCKWADPIYETTRLLQDAKSKQYDEKLYKLVVAMGSSRASVLGEATINLADYADASKPSSVSLSLIGCNYGTTLHVTVQLLTSKTGFREFEQQRELSDRGAHTGSNNKYVDVAPGRASLSGDSPTDQINKASAGVALTPEDKELTSVEEETGLSEGYADSTVGFDGSSNTSESLYTEKHELSSGHEIDSMKSTVSADVSAGMQFRGPERERGDPLDDHIKVMGKSDAVSQYSMAADLAVAYEENNRLKRSLELAESSLNELKLEVSSLQSLAYEVGHETQNVTHLISTEISFGEDLKREVSVLKLDCESFRDEIEKLRNIKGTLQTANWDGIPTDSVCFIQDIQLRWIKGILVVEDKIRELQNKTLLGFYESGFSALHSELEELLRVLRDMKDGTGEAVSSLYTYSLKKTDEMIKLRGSSFNETEQLVPGLGFGPDLCPPQSVLHHLNIPPPEAESSGAIDAMKARIFDLIRELDEAKAEREGLVRKLDQMECYYEALIHELEQNQNHVLGELQNLRNEHSNCLHLISSSQAETEMMREDMNDKIAQLHAEKRDVDALNKELERKAATSEAALRRARMNYSIAVDKLQKDLELLSSQVSSMFETNEKLIKQALSEPSQTFFLSCHDVGQNQGDTNTVKQLEFQDPDMGLKTQSFSKDVLLENLKKSLCLQEELYQKVEEELGDMHSINLHLDIFSKTLWETLLDADDDIALKNGKIDELVCQLKISSESNDQLMARLQTAQIDMDSLNEYNESCTARCNHLVQQNQVLEAKLESVSIENCVLVEKVMELEAITSEYRNLQCKYETYLTEKTELSNSLEQETLEKVMLQEELSRINEALKTLQTNLSELATSREYLQEDFAFVQDKLARMLEFYENEFSGLSLWTNSLCQNLELKDPKSLILQFEEIQKNACEKILELMDEKKKIEHERDLAEVSFGTAQSEFLGIKKRFRDDIQEMVSKLEVSNALVEKLQVELDSVNDKFHLTSEAEEKYSQQNVELLAGFALLEAELQKLTSKHEYLAEDISGLDTIAEEVERSKFTISGLFQEKQHLETSLKNKTEESAKLASDLSCLKEDVRNLHDELRSERDFRLELESTVEGLKYRLNEGQDKLHEFEKLETELVHFKHIGSDLEMEISRLSHLLMQQNKFLDVLQDEASDVTNLKSVSEELLEYAISADVKQSFLRNQYETHIQEHVQKQEKLDRRINDIQKRNHDVEAMLDQSLASALDYNEENAKLVTDLESLRFDLNASYSQNRVLSETNELIMLNLDEHKRIFGTLEDNSKAKSQYDREVLQLKDLLTNAEEEIGLFKEKMTKLEDNLSNAKTQHDIEVEQLKDLLKCAEEELCCLIFSKEEVEIIAIILKGKLQEQHACLTLLEENHEDLMTLKARCNELNNKLSEQVLKTEEFKNISAHLKELKDKADSEHLLTREKKDPEEQPVAMPESLRIVFIKEQYETKLHEIRQQLSISKRHSEEMLMKLQDAIDEIEDRKRNEAVLLKRNEDLAQKLLVLEAELQTVLSDKCETIKDYDGIKTELECALLSLECCREEKDKLEAFLQECEGERSKVSVELNLTKEQLEKVTTTRNIHNEENGGIDRLEHTPDDSTRESSLTQQVTSTDYQNAEDRISNISGGSINPSWFMNLQPTQDGTSNGVHAVSVHANNKFGVHSLRSSLDHLHEELERLKNENTLISNDRELNLDFQVVKRELTQLDKANEELRSMFPLFNEISSSGNAIERVLALEIELAESLRTKNKSSFNFQSSFLKQHRDDEAVFKSFRDINDLIKEMLEVKGRHAAVENELKEMQERYSQLSVQFAEVEGERQKLKMTLKNVKASRTPTSINRSLSAMSTNLP